MTDSVSTIIPGARAIAIPLDWSYIDQYLSDSQIPAERRRQLLDRSRQVWNEGLMFGHDLAHELLDKCDVQ